MPAFRVAFARDCLHKPLIQLGLITIARIRESSVRIQQALSFFELFHRAAGIARSDTFISSISRSAWVDCLFLARLLIDMNNRFNRMRRRCAAPRSSHAEQIRRRISTGRLLIREMAVWIVRPSAQLYPMIICITGAGVAVIKRTALLVFRPLRRLCEERDRGA